MYFARAETFFELGTRAGAELGVSFLGEFFYAHAEQEDGGDIDSIGGYALPQYRLNSRWAIGGRFDASECPGFANSLSNPPASRGRISSWLVVRDRNH